MNEELEHQYFTREQMHLWGQVNAVLGCVVITAMHFVMLLFGVRSLDWVFQGIFLIVLAFVGLLYYRLYKQTKEKTE